ncbi:tRNA1(Val) (adenine(37)-N6)-methyltransferase [Desulfobacter curvatus]|uniref:tRNA1(Val) (adenine(37)-N6)-methyltransferase n=1 Tax=Desulfobacter curvatus TaxID=2290 RepID=UPI001FDEB7BA|nr:methyltransferase [Desulfobacter curvatus]
MQPEKGYRYSMDPFVLCSQVSSVCSGDRILDVGCGCGIISVILGYCFPQSHITGVEIQTNLAEIAQKNINNNKLEQTVSIINADIKHISSEFTNGPFDLILSNPPYKRHNTGRLNPDLEKAIARHEITMDIQGLTTKADTLLRHKGRFMIIFPSERLPDIEQAVQPTSIFPEWIRYIYTGQKKTAKRVIFSGIKDITAPKRILPPIYLSSNNLLDTDILPKRIIP